MKTPSRRTFLALAAVLAASTLAPNFASAHEANCPYCDQPITQDTPTQDNEVVLKYGRKRIEYKCVYCALSEAQTEYSNGDVTIAAPSEKKGDPVILKRAGGHWSAASGAAYFVAQTPIKHRTCQATARAFRTKSAAQNYIKAHNLKAQPITLAQLVSLAK